MKEEDPLQSVLQEWHAPEPTPAVDQRILQSWRDAGRRPWWTGLWSTRVSIPVPVLAAALLLIAALAWFGFRSRLSPQPASVAPRGEGYTTQIEAAGFQPLPNGETRIIRSGGVK